MTGLRPRADPVGLRQHASGADEAGNAPLRESALLTRPIIGGLHVAHFVDAAVIRVAGLPAQDRGSAIHVEVHG